MRDLNPMQFFRGPAPEAKPDISQEHKEAMAGQKKPMTKVPSLLFDIEMDENQGSQPSEAGVEEILERLQQLLQGWSRPEKQLIQLVRKLYEDGARHGQALEADSLAEVLVQRGHTVTVRTALGGGGGCECLRNLRHVFLSVRIQHAAEALLVDPKFKEQFEIAHPTERYTELLAALPDFFVGTENRLITLVELLCSEMSAAFQTTGTTLPPWRQAPSMMSKWRPRRSTDDERRSSLCKPGSVGTTSFAVSVSADAGGMRRTPVLPAPLALPARRPSLLGRLGCEAPARQPARSRSPLQADAVNSRNRANAARTAGSLLAMELERPWKTDVQHTGFYKGGQDKGLKAVNKDEDDSPTSVLQAEQEAPPSSRNLWQLRGGFTKADATAMLYSSTRGLVTGGL